MAVDVDSLQVGPAPGVLLRGTIVLLRAYR